MFHSHVGFSCKDVGLGASRALSLPLVGYFSSLPSVQTIAWILILMCCSDSFSLARCVLLFSRMALAQP